MSINRVRIIGGQHRRRLLEFPDAQGLRPTPDRVRETLFNWLEQDLTGKHCLDLFAGSGALGLEAASRGAEQVVLVENNREAFRALQKNCEKLPCTHAELRCEDGLEYLRRENKRYDVIFVDPPFSSDLLPRVMQIVAGKLTEQGLLYVETGQLFEPGAPWIVMKRARAGQVHYQLLQYQGVPKND